MRAPPPSNPVKLPLYRRRFALCIVVSGISALDGSWLFAGAGLVAALLCLATIRVVRQGRNP